MKTLKLYTGLATLALGALLAGCAAERLLPQAMMPDAPKECDQVMRFQVDPLPKGASTATVQSTQLAKEGSTRQVEHEISRVCAEYALRAAGKMKDVDAPKSSKSGVNASRSSVTPRIEP
jgi:hypothetical protein